MVPSSKTSSPNKKAASRGLLHTNVFPVSLRNRGHPSCLDPAPFPKRDSASDFFRRGLGLGVIPGRIVVAHAIHFDMIIICGSLPGTNGSVVARLEKFFLHRPSRKILIPLHDGASIALCNDLAGPDRLWHNKFPQSSLLLSGSVQQTEGTLLESSAFERRNIHGRPEFFESH